MIYCSPYVMLIDETVSSDACLYVMISVGSCGYHQHNYQKCHWHREQSWHNNRHKFGESGGNQLRGTRRRLVCPSVVLLGRTVSPKCFPTTPCSVIDFATIDRAATSFTFLGVEKREKIITGEKLAGAECRKSAKWRRSQ